MVWVKNELNEFTILNLQENQPVIIKMLYSQIKLVTLCFDRSKFPIKLVLWAYYRPSN